MTDWSARRVSFGALQRHLEDVRREHPTWTWEEQAREANRRMKGQPR